MTELDKIKAALLTERAGYVARKLDARVKQVDAALKALGAEAPADEVVEQAVAAPALERAVKAVAAKVKG
jgi:hypothetical protein